MVGVVVEGWRGVDAAVGASLKMRRSLMMECSVRRSVMQRQQRQERWRSLAAVSATAAVVVVVVVVVDVEIAVVVVRVRRRILREIKKWL